MKIFARRGSETDGEILALLETEARSSLDHIRGGGRLAEFVKLISPNWSLAVKDAGLCIFVAGLDGVVMGFIVARISNTDDARIATIEQVFVTNDGRGLGVGDALISAIVAWAKSQGLNALDGFALPGDRETKNLYERAGLVARLITVSTDLRD